MRISRMLTVAGLVGAALTSQTAAATQALACGPSFTHHHVIADSQSSYLNMGNGMAITIASSGLLLTEQADGNLVLYYQPTGRVLWAAGTDRHPHARFVFQTDGNAVVYDGTTPLWNSGTQTSDNTGTHRRELSLDDAGRLEVVTAGGQTLWRSPAPFSAEVVSLVGTLGDPGWTTAAFQGDGNLVVRDENKRAVWASGTWGHPHAVAVLQRDLNLVVYDGSRALWSAGTYRSSCSTSCAYQAFLIADYADLRLITEPGDFALWSSRYGKTPAVASPSSVSPMC